MAKVEALPYDDRTVYSVAAFNRGVGQWLSRLPTVWVEGEVTELRRHERWATVFFTLKDPTDGSCVGVTMARGRFDALRLDLADGERVHVFGRPELYEQRAEFKLRALTIERFGVGAHLASLEQLKARLAGEGLFADSRKRPLPFLPRRIGVVTGSDAAAKRDLVTTIRTRFPPASVLVAETYVQGPRAAAEIVAAIGALCEQPDVDVVVLTRGGGSFEDLLPFSDERVVRAVAECRVPVVSAVGHEQDTATSRQTPAPPPLRPQGSWSCRSWLNCGAGSTSPAARSHATSGARSSGTASDLLGPPNGCVPGRAPPSSGRACGSSTPANGCARRPPSRSSGSGRASRRPPRRSLRCHLCKHSGEDTQSCGRSPGTSWRRPTLCPRARTSTSPSRTARSAHGSRR